MSSTKDVESVHPDNLPEVSKDDIAKALVTSVDSTSQHHDVRHGIHGHLQALENMPWVHELLPGIEELANKYHVGNFVALRGTNQRIFESMPIYARLGMHLLFYGKEEVKIVESHRVEDLLKQQSIKEGKIFDSPESVKNIPSFIETYSIDLNELLDPDLKSYKNFNEFFYRKLKPEARPIQNAADPYGIVSAADCRLTVYETVDLAKKFWIKGNNFTIANLLGLPDTDPRVIDLDGSNVAVFRLAPADYHRFHSPIDATVGEVTHIPGQYYTVNPQAVNEPGFDVFTLNTRSILYLTHEQTGKTVAFVAIGALLVGSIVFTAGGQPGNKVKRGEELGYFAYGGSTVVALFPKGSVKFDADLIANSQKPIETLMKVGWSLGTTPH